ncbi:Hypothetical_protein [Hexamita inflata]|uniref:Hypothetical_protein n=1 Tax=Hexamita inflata TaxID=28002 RepID=A0AA86TP77_9EUKA|nr:Hypothetical protein HINF_LOCUS12149 [Hexamita inflata]
MTQQFECLLDSIFDEKPDFHDELTTLIDCKNVQNYQSKFDKFFTKWIPECNSANKKLAMEELSRVFKRRVNVSGDIFIRQVSNILLKYRYGLLTKISQTTEQQLSETQKKWGDLSTSDLVKCISQLKQQQESTLSSYKTLRKQLQKSCDDTKQQLNIKMEYWTAQYGMIQQRLAQCKILCTTHTDLSMNKCVIKYRKYVQLLNTIQYLHNQLNVDTNKEGRAKYYAFQLIHLKQIQLLQVLRTGITRSKNALLKTKRNQVSLDKLRYKALLNEHQNCSVQLYKLQNHLTIKLEAQARFNQMNRFKTQLQCEHESRIRFVKCQLRQNQVNKNQYHLQCLKKKILTRKVQFLQEFDYYKRKQRTYMKLMILTNKLEKAQIREQLQISVNQHKESNKHSKYLLVKYQQQIDNKYIQNYHKQITLRLIRNKYQIVYNIAQNQKQQKVIQQKLQCITQTNQKLNQLQEQVHAKKYKEIFKQKYEQVKNIQEIRNIVDYGFIDTRIIILLNQKLKQRLVLQEFKKQCKRIQILQKNPREMLKQLKISSVKAKIYNIWYKTQKIITQYQAKQNIYKSLLCIQKQQFEAIKLLKVNNSLTKYAVSQLQDQTITMRQQITHFNLFKSKCQIMFYLQTIKQLNLIKRNFNYSLQVFYIQKLNKTKLRYKNILLIVNQYKLKLQQSKLLSSQSLSKQQELLIQMQTSCQFNKFQALNLTNRQQVFQLNKKYKQLVQNKVSIQSTPINQYSINLKLNQIKHKIKLQKYYALQSLLENKNQQSKIITKTQNIKFLNLFIKQLKDKQYIANIHCKIQQLKLQQPNNIQNPINIILNKQRYVILLKIQKTKLNMKTISKFSTSSLLSKQLQLIRQKVQKIKLSKQVSLSKNQLLVTTAHDRQCEYMTKIAKICVLKQNLVRQKLNTLPKYDSKEIYDKINKIKFLQNVRQCKQKVITHKQSLHLSLRQDYYRELHLLLKYKSQQSILQQKLLKQFNLQQKCKLYKLRYQREQSQITYQTMVLHINDLFSKFMKLPKAKQLDSYFQAQFEKIYGASGSEAATILQKQDMAYLKNERLIRMLQKTIIQQLENIQEQVIDLYNTEEDDQKLKEEFISVVGVIEDLVESEEFEKEFLQMGREDQVDYFFLKSCEASGTGFRNDVFQKICVKLFRVKVLLGQFFVQDDLDFPVVVLGSWVVIDGI